MIVNNSQYHKRLKHINIQWHWIQEQIQKGLLHLEECRDLQQTADILNKALTSDKYSQHIVGLGLCSAWGGVLGDESYQANLRHDQIWQNTSDTLYKYDIGS